METRQLHLSKNGELDIKFVEGEALERFDALAREALEEARKSLMMALRFLNSALWHLPPERALLARPLATNGRVLRFDPERVVERFRAGEGELTRDCLHTVLHCVFHHPFEKRHGEYAAWSLASDITVEMCALDLCGERFPSARDDERREIGAALGQLARNLTTPALYQVFRCGMPGEALYRDNGLTERDLDELSELFMRDAHDLWTLHPRFDDTPPESQGAAQAPRDLQAESKRTHAKGGTDADKDGHHSQAMPDADSGEKPSLSPEEESADTEREQEAKPKPPVDEPLDNADSEEANDEAAVEWERISKHVEAAIRAQRHSLNGGDGLLQNLTVANRKPANYDEFLRRFATMAEDMHVSDEEFDYVYYTYGLSHYGNVPLIEPLEYQESKRVREFVIALDTSGSCSGELIRTFVERTYALLRQQASFGRDINVHLVQSDMRVRSVTKVTSLRQLEEYADEFWVCGGGGTDFRPAFEYVDELVEAGEFNDLRGLIYFTDGYGTFPTRAPNYDVAFVFVDNANTNVRVPGWAMKVIMTQEEVLRR